MRSEIPIIKISKPKLSLEQVCEGVMCCSCSTKTCSL